MAERRRLPSALAAAQPLRPPPGLCVRPARSLGAGRTGHSGGNPAGWHQGTTLPAPELSRLRSDRACQAVLAQPRPPAPGALPEPGRRVSGALRTASSRAEEPPPAGMPPPAHAAGRSSGASRCPPTPASQGTADRVQEGLLDFSHPFESLGERQGTQEAQ